MPIKRFMQNLVRPSASETELQTISVALMGGSASGKTSFFQGIMESMVNKSVQLGGGEMLLIEPIKVSRGVSPAMDSHDVQEQVLISAPPAANGQTGGSIFSQMMSYASGLGAMQDRTYAQEKNSEQVADRDIEASDEAGHDGNLDLKLQTIDYLDRRAIKPIFEAVYGKLEDFDPSHPHSSLGEDVAIAVLPDHPTPVAHRTHTNEPVPFLIYKPGEPADSVLSFDEESCQAGSYGLLEKDGFIRALMDD